MEREEVELLPAGLITCLLNNKEVRIVKISPKTLTVRLAQEIEDIRQLKVAFYIFDENKYEEIAIEQYDLINKVKHEFYITYVFSINDEMYLKNVRKAFSNYTRYIRLKTYSDGNDFSKDMVGYPSEEDYDFYEDYITQKQKWMANLNYDNFNESILNLLEIAVNIDNYNLYKKYLNMNINEFMSNYLKENFIENHKLFNKKISRIYIGNEFCHNLFPKKKMLMDIIRKATKEDLEVTVCFTYIRECYIDNIKDIINEIYNWCIENNKKIEIVINDWGMLKLIENKENYLTLSLGVLLNKRKKDPRYIYKNGYSENKNLIGNNSLNSKIFSEFLRENNIYRYEYESCGYKINIAKGKHTLHLPFYVTNTSQYCTLYAKCTTMERGKQKLAMGCPMYCNDYVFSYPKHLKIIGRYNSLFSLDDTLLKDSKKLEQYINEGIDRILLNFI
ncbi:hypothetical protein [Clostridium celatum]|uniref:Uncharacterized protein n=1 Tax=Clostridium celatum DSM 1785 TaxID=545697 RepID=L1QED6_9CLOT|nr:hypothetical protein [Clostridium celatum]EKY26354.1 hypothetical protein HMPREF0216_01995 [Clostridium celatum DSM 1785]MCE9655805.1 hypothetical protein [Clostridium celatum]